MAESGPGLRLSHGCREEEDYAPAEEDQEPSGEEDGLAGRGVRELRHQARRPHFCRGRMALLAVLAVAPAALCWHRVARTRQTLRASMTAPEVKAKERERDKGCSVESGVEYVTRDLVVSLKGVPDMKSCRRKCFKVKLCRAWTWSNATKTGEASKSAGSSGVCLLKEVAGSEPLKKRKSHDVSSGLQPKAECMEEVVEEEEKEEQEEEEEEEDSGMALMTPTTAPEAKPGTIQNQHGICLEATSAAQGQRVGIRMMSCSHRFGQQAPRQRWFFNLPMGQIKNQQGMCLHAPHPHTDGGEVHLEWCCLGCSTQQWAFDRKTGQIVNWHGICIAALERHVEGSKVEMRSCDRSSLDQQWFLGQPYTTNRWYYDSPVSDAHYKPGSLYCYALMLPHGGEQELLEMQKRENASIFGCDEAAVYSNMSIELSPGFKTFVVNSDLKCKTGGEFRTALNLGIFIIVWQKVIKVGRFRHHDWTVKVDPDSVFFPDRLRQILEAHPVQQEEAVYLNNCKFGMHGPLEVLSKAAVEAWGKGVFKCVKHFWKLCSGDCMWGEDMFIDQCLMRVLKVRRDNEFRLLSEEHCDPGKDWHSCEDRRHAAFHPFKEGKDYRRCRETAKAAAA
eukprot:CAMPEP_0179093060 /NCGR_PEP_ID=MMETSP0796-20121207/42596_1 /TAXON_ID=73915 /ORGANISM="Pyrodinium bahamense, Strain pbaha01" /LENGTH=617 /DNA_ID=CAMNT_0020790681 /DNA_START=32 /DNA_END=1885 /DNA_ORIENTATION=+